MKRRDVLRAGAAVVGASLLPSAPAAAPAGDVSEALEVLRADYRRRVAALAERVRGWAADPGGDGSWNGGGVEERAMWRLEAAARREFCHSAEEARLVRVFSAFAEAHGDLNDSDAGAAAQLAAADVALAIDARWYLDGYGLVPDAAHKEEPCACGRETVRAGWVSTTWDEERHEAGRCTRRLYDESGSWKDVIVARKVAT